MQSRGLVLKTLEFGNPERIPLVERMPFVDRKSADIIILYWSPADNFTPQKQGEDEWGCVWKSLNPGLGDQGQVVEHPLADWKNSSHYRFPDPYAAGRVDNLPPSVDKLKREGKFICGSIGHGPMHLMPDIRGFENYLMDMKEYPERTNFMLEGIFTFLRGLTDRYSRLGLDAIWLWDDQAMQSGPLFSMDLWCKFFKPRYKELFSFAHSRGLKVFMHACGHLGQHLPHLIESGVDVIDNKQPSLWMDSPAVKKARGKISFSTCLDIQTTINTIAEENVEEAAFKLIKTLSIPSGGFIGTCYSNPDLKIKQEKTLRMIKAFKTFRWNA
ncbi:MAG TPA: uroporphyrinogen decarboxylase family protein [bacterium]|jgi:uroporphyrinogen decarboxylase|nr:uroporphyrinogen decarboxylase family protein [bacterium]